LQLKTEVNFGRASLDIILKYVKHTPNPSQEGNAWRHFLAAVENCVMRICVAREPVSFSKQGF
jgi:hypothetical protein